MGGRRSPDLSFCPPTTHREARMMTSIAIVNARGEMVHPAIIPISTRCHAVVQSPITLDFHPCCSASTASSVYLRLLRSNASSTAASQGTVSSMMYTVWSEEDQSTRSGLRFVMAISEGKQSLWFRSAANFQSRAPPSWPMSDGIWTLTVFTPSLMNSLANEGWTDVRIKYCSKVWSL